MRKNRGPERENALPQPRTLSEMPPASHNAIQGRVLPSTVPALKPLLGNRCERHSCQRSSRSVAETAQTEPCRRGTSCTATRLVHTPVQQAKPSSHEAAALLLSAHGDDSYSLLAHLFKCWLQPPCRLHNLVMSHSLHFTINASRGSRGPERHSNSALCCGENCCPPCSSSGTGSWSSRFRCAYS